MSAITPMAHGASLRRCILIEMACLLYRNYGAGAYQAFVVDNPGGRVRGIERAIMRGWGAA